MKITHKNKPKEIIIQEESRVRVRNADGKKISGKLEIVDTNSIRVAGQTLQLSELKGVKKNPLGLSIATKGVLIYGGALTIGMGTIIGVFVDTKAFLLFLPGSAMIYTGTRSPNILKNYKLDKGWSYELVSLD